VAGSCAFAAESTNTPAPREAQKLEQQWGIHVTGVHLSANGYMVDFRYKVLDPQKASSLGDPKARPYLLDQSTGVKLPVPRSPKVGPLRQSAEQMAAGKVYFTLFSNAGRAVKTGSKVTVIIGDFQAADLVVE
jgi:hypothetical protein